MAANAQSMRLVSSAQLSLKMRTAFALEAKVAAHLFEKDPRFVRGFEGAAIDLGIRLYSQSSPQRGITTIADAFFETFEALSSSSRRCFALIDVKSMVPRRLRTQNRRCTYLISINATQYQNCDAIIVTSVYDPRYAALLPMAYVCNNSNLHGDEYACRLGDECSSVYKPPGFPSSLSPFMVPFERLHEAVNAMCKYMEGESKNWINPVTGLIYEGCPKPQPGRFSFLTPSSPANYTAMQFTHLIWQSFKCSAVYNFELVRTTPSNGDIKITHIPTGIVVSIELKVRQCHVDDIDNPKTLEHVVTGASGAKIFHPLVPWDYILTGVGWHASQPTHAILLSRDDIPDHWWREKSDELHSWKPDDPKFLSFNVVHLTSAEQAMADMTKILQGRQQQGAVLRRPPPLKAQKVIPMEWMQGFEETIEDGDEDAGDFDNDDDDDDDDDIQEVNEEDRAKVKHPLADDPRRFNPPRLAGGNMLWQAENTYSWIMDHCARQGQGIVFQLPKYCSEGRFAYFRYTWTAGEQRKWFIDRELPCQFYEMDHRTHLVYVDLLTLPWPSFGLPITGSKKAYLTVGTGQVSLVIGKRRADVQHEFACIIPSRDISTGEIYRSYNMFVSTTEPHVAYYTKMDTISAKIKEFLEGKAIVTIGEWGIEVEARGFLHVKREIVSNLFSVDSGWYRRRRG